MQSFQNEECASLMGAARQEWQNMKDRLERHICSSADTQKLQRPFDLFISRCGISIQEFSIWFQCCASGFLQAHEVRSEVIMQVRNQFCLLPRRHMCTSEDDERNVRTHIQDDDSFITIGFF